MKVCDFLVAYQVRQLLAMLLSADIFQQIMIIQQSVKPKTTATEKSIRVVLDKVKLTPLGLYYLEVLLHII